MLNFFKNYFLKDSLTVSTHKSSCSHINAKYVYQILRYFKDMINAKDPMTTDSDRQLLSPKDTVSK